MNSSEKIYEGVRLAFEGVGEVAGEYARLINQACNIIVESINSSYNRKMSKKRFRKLLQSFGIQRNETNRMLHNNKEPYTYGRLYYLIGGTNEAKQGRL